MARFKSGLALAALLVAGATMSAAADDTAKPERGMDTQPAAPGDSKASERASSAQPPVKTETPEEKDKERGHAQ